MAAPYSLIGTENLGDDQKRFISAYEITGAGCIVNVVVTLVIKAPYQADTEQNLLDEEVFVPGIKLSDLASLGFIPIQTLDLGKGQKRIIRGMTIPANGSKILSVVATVEYKEGKKTRTIVRSEELTYSTGTVSVTEAAKFKTPQGTWVDGTSIDFASRPGQPSTNRLLLSDNKLRSFSGTLAWRHSNLVLDLGWDEENSHTGGDKWIWWYIVPRSDNDKLLTVVASDNPPSSGPAGRSPFKVCWVDYRLSGNMLKLRQTGNRFDHTYRDVYADYDVSDESAYSSFALNNFVPETASIARLYHRSVIYGTQASQDRWYCRICATAVDSALLNFIDIRSPWDTQRTPAELTSIASHSIPSVPHTIPAISATTRSASPTAYMHSQSDSFEAPLFTNRTLYKKRDRVAGSQNVLYLNQIAVYGWVDAWVEP